MHIRFGLFSSLIRKGALFHEKGNFPLLMGFMKGETHIITFAFSELMFRKKIMYVIIQIDLNFDLFLLEFQKSSSL